MTKGPGTAGRPGRGPNKGTNVPTTKENGNQLGDQSWIAEMEAAGELLPIDIPAEHVPYGARMQWTGKAEDVGSSWQYPPHLRGEESRLCIGHAYLRDHEGKYILDADHERIKRPCTRWPIIGGKVCVSHGGGVERAKAAAIERMAGALDAATGALVAVALNPKTPPRDRVMAINSLMDRVGVRAGTEVAVNVPQWQGMLREMFEQAAAADKPAAEEEDD